MVAGKSVLAQILRDEIRAKGPISFGRFMQYALYHPEHGYYSSGRATIGRTGDYFTNVSVGPVFGTLLATQFIEVWERLGRSDDFIIVEQGAHDGYFAHDVLSAIRQRAPQLFDAIRYRIVEPFPVFRERQRRTLEGRAQLARHGESRPKPPDSGTTQRSSLHDFLGKVEWRNEIEPFIGVHFSNELLDAMPVNLRGKSVGLDGDRFVFVESDNGESAPNQSQLDWIEHLSTKLQRGLAITVDYGFVRSEFHEVVQARSQHRLLQNAFEEIGNADISVHINWTDIAERGEEFGFQIAGYTDQHHFLTGLISSDSVNSTELFGGVEFDRKQKRELQTLLHPEMLGRAFQVLGLAKGINLTQPLAGFRFARDARTALELKS